MPASAAGKIAHERLVAFLSPEERERFRACGCFYVTSNTGRTWRLGPRVVGLVSDSAWMDSTYCIHFADSLLPHEDCVLALALLLATDEARFLSIAHRW